MALPWVFKESGILGGILLVLVVGYLSLYSERLIVSSATSAFQGPVTFAKLGEKIFGKAGRVYSELCVVLFMIGAQVSYLIIIGELLSQLLEEVGLSLPPLAITGIIAGVVIFPLSSLKHMDSLKYSSFVALFFMVSVIVKTSNFIAHYELDTSRIQLFGSFAGFFVSLPIVNFAFTFHPSVMPVWSELQDQSPSNINFISALSVSFCALVYILLGIFGYLFFLEGTPDNILVAYDEVYFKVIRVGYSLVIIFSYPVINFGTRLGIDQIFFKTPATQLRIIIESLAIVAICFVVAMFIPNIEVAFGLVGSTVGQLVVFINPAMFYVLLHKKSNFETEDGHRVQVEQGDEDSWRNKINNAMQLYKLPAIILVIAGIICGIVSLIEIIRGLVNPAVLH
uniref:Amino acid transporter transmembrane domain-containing protein n=1 Tax=Arcella intermedia TaxID=1963864 RepID=A0A6B2L4Z7_9EUKA